MNICRELRVAHDGARWDYTTSKDQVSYNKFL